MSPSGYSWNIHTNLLLGSAHTPNLSENYSWFSKYMFALYIYCIWFRLKLLTVLNLNTNLIYVQWILHDWGDEQSVKILKKCKKAIPSKDEGGKVIIIDMVIENQSEDKNSTTTQLCFDMMMMSLFNTGKERSLKEWKKLFSEAGFSSYKIIPILGVRSLIEVYPWFIRLILVVLLIYMCVLNRKILVIFILVNSYPAFLLFCVLYLNSL